MPPTDLSVTTEDLPGSQVGITIEVAPERVDQAYDRVLQRLSQRVKIEGFRPGKAPRPLIEARVGPAALREEVIDFLVPPLVSEALRERSIEAIDRPRVEVRELERGRPARLVARVSIWPPVTLPDLDTLRVEKATTQVGDEMIERRITELRGRLAEIVPVEREVRVGDVVVADLRLSVAGEDVPSEARTAMEMEVSDGVLIPELRAVLVGRSVGEVAVANVVMPDDHSNAALRGKTAALQVTVQGVKEKRLPELTDETASELSDGEHSTVEALREAVRSDLVSTAARLDDLNYERRVIQEVVDRSSVQVPEALVEREIDRQALDLEKKLAERGLRLERYLQYRGQSLEAWRAEEAAGAKDRLRADLVLAEVGKRIAVSPSEDEVSDHIRAEAARDPDLRDSSRRVDELVDSAIAREHFGHRLTRLRILEALVARASGEGAAAVVPGEAQGSGEQS